MEKRSPPLRVNYDFSKFRVAGDARQDGDRHCPSFHSVEKLSTKTGRKVPREDAGEEGRAWDFPTKSQWESRLWREAGERRFWSIGSRWDHFRDRNQPSSLPRTVPQAIHALAADSTSATVSCVNATATQTCATRRPGPAR